MKSNVSGGIRSRIVSDVLIAVSVFFAVFYFSGNFQKPASVQNVNAKALLFGNHLTHQQMSSDEFPKMTEPLVFSDQPFVPLPEKKDFSIGPFSPLIPPVHALNIPHSTKKVNAGTGERITTKNNSVIQVPANAFVNANGNPVTGDVDLSWREFRDRWDMFVSNIPMHYDSAGYDMLESAGMIELRASQNGEPVFPSPDNSINVMLASANTSDGFNIYYFDEKKNKWDFVAKDTKLVEEVRNSSADNTPAPQLRRNINRNYKFRPSEFTSCLYSKSDMAPRKPFLFSRKRSPDHFEFTITTRRKSPPENKIMKNMYWTYSGKDASDVYQIIFMNGKTQFIPSRTALVSNLDIQKKEGGYKLSFVRDQVYYEFEVQPYYVNENSVAAFDTAYSKYRLAYDNRLKQEEQNYASFRTDSAELNSAIVDNSIARTESQIMRVFNVNNFGLWNVDKPFRTDLPKMVLASFRDANGRTLLISSGYMAFKDINSVIRVNDPSQFRYNPNGGNLFWAVLNRDRVAIVYPEEFAKHANSGGEVTFVAKVYEDMASAKKAMSGFIGAKANS